MPDLRQYAQEVGLTRFRGPTSKQAGLPESRQADKETSRQADKQDWQDWKVCRDWKPRSLGSNTPRVSANFNPDDDEGNDHNSKCEYEYDR